MNAPATQKQRLNVYTVMLITSSLFLICGSVCMYVALQQFGSYPYWKTTEAQINPVR